jgi:glutathione S-transferase
MDELNLDYERREEITTPSVEERAGATPTLQVPTLWDGDNVLWESGLIADYLLETYSDKANSKPTLASAIARDGSYWNDRKIFATVQTLGTAATTISQMKWSGIAHCDNQYLTRCADRLPHLMAWLDSELASEQQGFFADVLSVQDIFLACHLGFTTNRPIDLDPELDSFPKIQALIERCEGRQAFRNNPILWWDPGVIGYAADGRTPLYRS